MVGSDPIARLALRLSNAIDTRLPDQLIVPFHYHPSFPMERYKIPIAHNEHWIVPDTAFAKQRRVYAKLLQVLSIWLGFPQDISAQPRAWLTMALVGLFGLDILHCTASFDLNRHFAARVLNIRTGQRKLTQRPEMSALLPLLLGFVDHPLLNPRSRSTALVKLISFAARRLATTERTPIPPRLLTCLEASFVPMEMDSDAIDDDGRGASQSPLSPTSVHHSHLHLSTSASSNVQLNEQPAADNISFPNMSNPSHTTTPPATTPLIPDGTVTSTQSATAAAATTTTTTTPVDTAAIAQSTAIPPTVTQIHPTLSVVA
ncbi:hypothetical protein BV25DRAFT_1922870 [Artomyces pyxidatus]|uniref:Uncharacterized protein n=1 Tax=Artomyces pyxidatus TaxID=48021 RepID=A0ACB8SDF5_9AGAM|nr:hypothetical protein BV25DRAFT_1922870 [Artomyces pyxidatus]